MLTSVSDFSNPFPRVAAVDFGNSACKLLITSINHISSSTHVPGSSDDFFIRLAYDKGWTEHLIKLLVQHQILKIGISTVQPHALKEFLEYWEAHAQRHTEIESIQLFTSDDLLASQKHVNTTLVSGIGSDRIFGLLGAQAYNRQGLITIDCGTATTINALSANNHILGGAILPGIATQFRSLAHFTAKLPDLSLDDKVFNTVFPDAAGTSTYEAIRLGVLRGSVGAIREIVQILRKQLKSEGHSQSAQTQTDVIPVIVTGGFGMIIFRELQVFEEFSTSLIYDEHCVQRGIISCMEDIA